MKINPIGNNSAIEATSPVRPARSPTDPRTGTKPAVELSPKARQLASLHNGNADIDSQKVQKLQQAITEGKLAINPEKIADSLLASVHELLK